MDTCLAVAACLVLCQGGEEDKKGWSFQEVLVIYFLPFKFWAGALSIKCASYMRGLHARTSNILLILAYYPISFHQLLCSFSDFTKNVGAYRRT